ncbi:MAG: HAMP domain-containing histidine kinase [Lachnospiraceae bacterium]|nr:HAMP domain-containing histidine kinase [Lachnospiraceae bacterium]
MMNKTAFKIFVCFTFLSSFIATILLVINFLGFLFVGSDTTTQIHEQSPERMLEQISDSLETEEGGFALSDESLLADDCFCILIGENGNVLWSQNMPGDIPMHYSINDVARMTRWFLNDYPVYVRTRDEGLLVLGLPKKAVGKYAMAYSMEWFDSLPRRLISILVLNLLLAAVLALLIGSFFYRRITMLTNGMSELRQEKHVSLKEKGIFKELARNINDTSLAIHRKNAALSVRDHARTNWISGISHDVRTPLAVIMGNSQMLENEKELSEENKKRAAAITGQAVKIKKLVEDLNLISSLEYDMQPTDRKLVRLCPLIRETVSDILNSGLAAVHEVELDVKDEKMTVLADQSLLQRAIFNLINNSITHNPGGCQIQVQAYADGKDAHIYISDNGTGMPEEVIERLTDQGADMPRTAHGRGLFMANRIITVHGGSMHVHNENGCVVEMILPLA